MRAAWTLAALAACTVDGGVDIVHGTAVDHGLALVSDPGASPSASNAFSCATCHPTSASAAAGRVYPGGSLVGATARTTFWGGRRADLLEAINDCRLSFMDAPAPWTAGDPDAEAVWAYLASLGGSAAPVPFTAVLSATDLPPGDGARGAEVFAHACEPCHGTPHDGAGRLASFIPTLPDGVDQAHAGLALAARRLVYLQKIRSGGFTQIGGSMAPFSVEALSDADVAGVLVFLGQY